MHFALCILNSAFNSRPVISLPPPGEGRGGAFLQVNRSVAHARCGGQSRQKCCERGYYHLHRYLYDVFLSHNRQFSNSSFYYHQEWIEL